MPLVVPNVNSSQGDKNEWLNKLAGKKISESTADVNVYLLIFKTAPYDIC